MAFIETVAYLGAGVLMLITFGAVLMALWGRASDEPVLLYAMLRRQGDRVAYLATASGSRDFAVAVRKCVRCRSTARCRAFLDAASGNGFEEFCGNAGYVSHMRDIATLGRAP